MPTPAALFLRLFADFDLTNWHQLPSTRISEWYEIHEEGLTRMISLLVRSGILEVQSEKKLGVRKNVFYRIGRNYLLSAEEWAEQIKKVDEVREREEWLLG